MRTMVPIGESDKPNSIKEMSKISFLVKRQKISLQIVDGSVSRYLAYTSRYKTEAANGNFYLSTIQKLF